ncbi:MAG: patatin [Halobacteriovorax sp.]|nr:patatin [Halobacteriovorax sp.]
MIKLRKIGLALGGGGARGTAHIGVIRHLESIDLKPDVLAGTSAGAVIAALYAFGVSSEDIAKDLSKLKAMEFSALRLPKLGLIENIGVLDLITNRIGKDAKIEDAKIPLAIKATDIVSGESVLMTKGSLLSAVLASCCVPGVYIPVERDGRILVDGGLTENVPVSALSYLGAHIKIAVNLNGNQGYPKPDGILDVLANALDISIDHQTKEQLEEADIVISMDLSKYGRFKNERANELIDEGSSAAKEEIPAATWLLLRRRWRQWKQLFKQLSPIKIPDFIKEKFKHNSFS